MKRTPLKRGTKQLKRSGFKKRLKLPLSKTKRTTGRIKPTRGIPKWLSCIPNGSHGSNQTQKKLWKLTSDYVRIKDFIEHGTCVDCGKRFEDWKDGHCGHYKAWAVCNAYFKFNEINLSLQSPNCNRLSDGVVGYRFAEELKRRKGSDILEKIETLNNENHGKKVENYILIQMAEDLLKRMQFLEYKPDYFEKSYALYLQSLLQID